MLLLTQFKREFDIIDIPQSAYDRITELQDQFFAWRADRSADHPYWVCAGGGDCDDCYHADAFVNWLNAFPLQESEEKADVVAERVTGDDGKLPLQRFY